MAAPTRKTVMIGGRPVKPPKRIKKAVTVPAPAPVVGTIVNQAPLRRVISIGAGPAKQTDKKVAEVAVMAQTLTNASAVLHRTNIGEGDAKTAWASVRMVAKQLAQLAKGK